MVRCGWFLSGGRGGGGCETKGGEIGGWRLELFKGDRLYFDNMGKLSRICRHKNGVLKNWFYYFLHF